MNPAESKYVENRAYLSRVAREGIAGPRESWGQPSAQAGEEAPPLGCAREDLPKYVPFLTGPCDLDFRGRILEIGSGSAWFSAELSKLPRVVAIITTDPSPRLLKEHAPKTFRLLHAHTEKITRMPADFHNLDFPNSHFDFVVCAGVLHRAANIVQALREAKRVLKPGGQFVAIREPVWPLVKIKSRARMLAKLLATGVDDRFYTLADYKEFFRQAALPLRVQRVNLSSGFKYYVNKVVNGLTHARYAFVGIKRGRV
jgi:ubiquinone/menaquinone biosynthesis C-methylase UbiE